MIEATVKCTAVEDKGECWGPAHRFYSQLSDKNGIRATYWGPEPLVYGHVYSLKITDEGEEEW